MGRRMVFIRVVRLMDGKFRERTGLLVDGLLGGTFDGWDVLWE